MILTTGGYFYGTCWVAWQQSGYVNRIGGYKYNFTRDSKTYPLSLSISMYEIEERKEESLKRKRSITEFPQLGIEPRTLIWT